MKVKTSISLSADLLEALDRVADGEPRSTFIETVLREYLRRREREEGDARDLELINAAADRLNAQAAEVMKDQVLPENWED